MTEQHFPDEAQPSVDTEGDVPSGAGDDRESPETGASAGGEQQTMNLLPGLAQAQCPVLVMAGEQDPVCPLADSQDIAAALPAGLVQLATFAGSGHGAWRDEPEAAFAVLRRFILEAGA